MAAPSSTMSLTRKPPASEPGTSAPGVVKRNERVVRKMAIPARLPTADSFGDTGRRAIKMPVATSDMPKRFDTPWRPSTGYSQLTNRLWATNGWMAFASKAKNFVEPIAINKKTKP